MNFKILIAIGVVFLGFSSCSTEVENPNTVTVDTFWMNETDAMQGLNAVYNMFYKPGTYSRWYWFRNDLVSDEGFSQSPNTELAEWTRFIYNNYNYNDQNVWTYHDYYEAIFRANQVLTNVPEIEFEDEEKKDEIMGQARFLRGLYYFNLALLWGTENKSIAIVTEVSTPDMQPEGYSEEEVLEQAIEDFTAAAEVLPEEWDNSDKGRATKGAARAYRAKVYMQLQDWEGAKEDLEWMVEGAGAQYYGLADNYFDNFTKENENNIESVFEIQYSDENPAPAGDGDFDKDPNLGLNRGQFFGPPGIGWTDGEMRPWIVDEFKKEKDLNGDNDIRLMYTAFYEGMEDDFPDNDKIYNLTSNEETWGQGAWKGRVFFRKYSTSYYRDAEDYYNPINVRALRYADILLMYAETIVETGGSLSKAVDLVNQVRRRSNMPDLSVNHSESVSSPKAFLKRLQMERVLELSSEGWRWADLQRWGLLEDSDGIEELKSRDPDFNNFEIGKHNAQPIPTDEVSNNPNIEQNPNY